MGIDMNVITARFFKLFCVLLLPIVVVGCMKHPTPPPMQPPVKVEEVKLQKVENTSDYVATLISRKSTNILPRITGPINNIYVKDGDIVKKGTVLMTIESSQQAAAAASAVAKGNSARTDIQQAEAMVKSYTADREAANSDLKLNKIQLDRYSTLFEKGSVTRYDLDQAINNYHQAESKLKSLDEQIQAQKQTLKSKVSTYSQAKEDAQQQGIALGYYKILAPFDGQVGGIPVKIGDYVTQQTTLTSVTENKQLELEIGVDTSLKNKLKKGLTVKILDSSGKEVAEAKVYFISPTVDLQNQSILIKAILNNSDRMFNADQVINSRIVWNIDKKIAIPTESVVNFAGQDFVFLLGKSKGGAIAKQQPVTLGNIQNNKYVVLEGLKKGDNLIVSGVQKLRDGVPVNVQK